MIPLAIYMKSKTTDFACLLIMICFYKINSILAPGTNNLKVRLDVFSIYSNYNRIFYGEKKNSHFYLQQGNKTTLLWVHFPLATDFVWIMFLPKFEISISLQPVKNNMHKNKQVSTMHNPPVSWHLWHHIIVLLAVKKGYLGNITLPDALSEEEIKKQSSSFVSVFIHICECVYSMYIQIYNFLHQWKVQGIPLPHTPSKLKEHFMKQGSVE